MKREPGFMGLAKQNAKQGMYQVPKRYQPQGGGAEEYPAFVNQQEMALLKQQGGKGFMTPYGVPSFETEGDYEMSFGGGDSSVDSQQSGNQDFGYQNVNYGTENRGGYDGGNDGSSLGGDYHDTPQVAPKKPEYSIGYDSTKGLWENIQDINIPGWIEQEWDKLDFSWLKGGKPPGELTETQKMALIKNNPEAQQQIMGSLGGPAAAAAASTALKKEKLSGERRSHLEGEMRDADGNRPGDEGYDESTAEMDTSDSYEGYKQQHKGLGAESKKLTEGVMTDASGKTEGQEGYDATTATMQGGFAGDVKKLGAYQSKFDQLGDAAGKTGKEGQEYFAGVMTDASGKKEGEEGYDASTAKRVGGAGTEFKGAATTGQTAATTAAGDIKTATTEGQAAATTGSEGFVQGAQDVSGVQTQFGKEGFQKEAGGYQSQIGAMADKAASGQVGQREASMLKGQMEEGRLASQKGSEEKLRREMAQSGASPAEIAAKVAQFQKQSAGQQAQAGRSEALSSQLQGQQMGQASLGQAAGLTGQAMGALGQKAGMAGQQASLGAQQAALRGRGAAMNMQGAQMGVQGAQAAGQMGMAGAQMGMQGIQGAGQMYGQGMNAAFQGQQQQGAMYGQGMGAVQAAGGARKDQMAGLDQQGGFIDSQGNYTQAQLNDVISRQTTAYDEEQAKLTREANASANSGGGGGGGGFDLFNVGTWSDIRLKDNIELLEEGKDGDPNIYSFNYKWDSDTTWSGVMAQELLNTRHADAVMMSPEGFYKVDYTKLGIQFKQLST